MSDDKRRDCVTQGEIAALMEEWEEVEKARKDLQQRVQAVIDRVKAGAKVQRGFYRVVENRMMGCSFGFAIQAGRAEPRGGMDVIELGKPKGGA